MSFSNVEHGSVPHKSSVAVVVQTSDSRLLQEAQEVRKKLGSLQENVKHLLHFGPECIDLRMANKPSYKGYSVDFSLIDRRTGAGNLSKKQPLPKAIGLKNTTVIDATAGFGGDAAMVALMGYKVTAIERSPVISVMVRDGLFRACQDYEFSDALGGRLFFEEEDALLTLQNYQGVDVVYLDPMFPPKRKKSALPPKQIQLLQSIVGCDSDDETSELFELALQTAAKRVVVKRPLHAPHLGENPVAVHTGKLVRYEVYRGV